MKFISRCICIVFLFSALVGLVKQFPELPFTPALQFSSLPVHKLWIHLVVREGSSSVSESITAPSRRGVAILTNSIRVLRGL